MARPRIEPTAAIRERVAQAIRMGATYEHAALYGGVSYDTFNRWMQRGERAGRGEFREFRDAVKAAEGEAVLLWLAKIEKAATDGSWQAAAWKLERRYPAAYGRQMHQHSHEVTGRDGGPIQTEHTERQVWEVFGKRIEF